MQSPQDIWQVWTGIPDVPAPEGLAAAVDRMTRPPGCDAPSDSLFQTAFNDRLFHGWAKKQGVTPKPFWPGSAPYAFCLTHDIDRIFATLHRLKEKGPLGLRLRKLVHDLRTRFTPTIQNQNPFYNFDRMRELEGHWGVRSACYVLFERRRFWRAVLKGEPQHVIGVYRPRKIKQALKEYAERGNEVGLHGSFDSWDNGAVLSREKRELESFGVGTVEGIRNHYLNFHSRRSLEAQREADFLYDSTMGFNFQSGFRCGTSFPFPLRTQWEIPFATMDTSLRHEFPLYSDRLTRAMGLLDEVRGQGGVMVVNWHLQVMNAEAFPQEMELLGKLVERAVKEGAWICCPRDVAAHWEERRRALCIPDAVHVK